MKLLALLAATSVTLIPLTPARAEPTNWIDHYIAAHGHCTQQPGGPYTTLDPLEKPIEEWSPQDLADLKSALGRCEALPEEETGVARMWTGAFYEKIAALVQAQQLRAAQQAEAQKFVEERATQEAARRARKVKADALAAQDRLYALQRAAEQEAADRQAANERTKEASEEAKAAARLADAAEARAKAAQEEAHARLDVEDARQRAAKAETAARTAEQQAAADRQAADRRLADAYPSTQAPMPGSSHQIVFELRERTVGCTSKTLFDQTLAAIDAQDLERAAQIAAQGQERGLCSYVQPGTYLLKERNTKSACVAPLGSGRDCSWIFNYLTK